ncbi:60S ribosomal protein L27e [Boletus coccyginus]|nr:60S ribosomal protein L27e [Boletus coccyginus]
MPSANESTESVRGIPRVHRHTVQATRPHLCHATVQYSRKLPGGLESHSPQRPTSPVSPPPRADVKMPKIYKPGKVAIVLQGRQAGKKVVVIKQLDEGTKERPYPHAIVAGVERYPRKVTRRMSTKKVQRRSRVKPFIKTVNYSHLFPTRYALELENLKGAVAAETFKEPTQRENARKNIKKLLEERYQSGKNKWFFQPLRF